MIRKDEVMQLLLDACPSFREPWQAYLAESTYEPDLLYLDLAELVHHLVRLKQRDEMREFPKVFAVIERLHIEGEPFVKEAATIGLLEGIQNFAGNNELDPERFREHLGPESAKWWDELNRFWAGNHPTSAAA